MSIRSEITRINNNIAAAYSAAESKGATMPATENSANLAQTVASIPEAVQPTLITKQITANGTYTAADDNADGYSQVTVDVAQPQPIEEKAVNFYDYDGTVLYAYTAQEAMALTALPEAPTHDGLTFQGWNRTLAQLQAYVTDYGIGDAGATYITDDGATRLYLEVGDNVSLDYELYVQIANGTLSVEVDGQVLGSATGTTSSYYTIPFTLPSSGAVRADLKFTGTGNFRIGHGFLRTRIFGWNSDQNDTLVKVEFGNNVTFIGNNAFYGCSSLNSVVIPNSVTSIGNSAFYGCASLNSVVIPDSVLSIGANAFQGCASLNSVVIPDSVTSISNYAFQGCASLNSVVIPDSVTSISSYALQSCSSLNSVVIPDSVTSIGNNALQSCSSLNSVVIPDSVTSIGAYALQGCSLLNSVVIPDSVTSIGNSAFQGCSLLLWLDLSLYTDPSKLPTLVHANALNGTPTDQTILVYDQACLDALSTMTNWSTYADRFKIKGDTP